MKNLSILFSLFLLGACSSHPKKYVVIQKNEINSAIMAHKEEFGTCYNQALKTDKDLSGKLTVDFEINEDGKLVKAAVRNTSDIKNSDLQKCVVGKFSDIRFPHSRKGTVAVVAYPFIFKNPSGTQKSE